MNRRNAENIFIMIIFVIISSPIASLAQIKEKNVFSQQAQKQYERVNIVGDAWAYDPSVEYGDDNVGWLAYSSAPEIKSGLVETYLAKTNDEGKTWTKVNKIDEARDVVLQEKSGLFSKALKETQARLRHETPTLLYDPYDPDPEKRWKLFWIAAYLKLPSELGGYNKNTIWQYAQVFYKHARSPDKLAGAKEIRLFGTKWLNNCLSEICRVKSNLNQLHPDLADTTFYMEPGSLVKDGVIYLTFTAASVKRLQRTILISSKDHGQTWRYAGELTNKDTLEKDVDKNYTPEQLLLTSSALAEEGGRQFLLVSPRNRGGQGKYNGVYIFEFDDITRGKLKRNSEGKLVVHKYLPAISSEWVGGGQSEYHEKNTYGGIIMAQTDNSKLGQKEFFKVYNTREKIESYRTLNITISGQGTGSVDSIPAGIQCSPNFGDLFDCSEDYAFGTQVTLHPAVVHGFFAGWLGDPDCFDGIVSMDASKTCDARFELPTKPYERINIVGQNTEDASKGVFDPSLEHDDNGVVWMVYTAIGMENKGNAHSTDLAKSEDGGKTWWYVARINDSPMGEVTLKGKKIFGNWRNEVATLVDDKDDPDSSKRWKLFWHKYFQKSPFGERDRVLPHYGWIAYKYAASPEGLAKAGEIRLFGNYPFPFNPQNGEPGYPVIHYLDRIDKNLKGFLSFTEPGFLAKDGMLYLSIEGIPSDFDKRTIFLISSKDHGNTWQYNGVLLNKKDANDFNTHIFTASSLFEENGKVFLLASPVTPKGHNGILVFEFENIAEAKLKRDSSGNLIPVQRVEPFIEGEFSGCGDYDSKKTYGGIVMSATDVLKAIEKKSTEGGMQIFDTKERLSNRQD